MTESRKSTTADGFLRGPRSDRSLAKRSLILVVGFFLFTLFALSLLGENGLGAWFRLHAQERDLQRDVANLENQNGELNAKLDHLESDPVFLEKLAREEFNMQKSDEEVLLIVPANSGIDGSAD